MVKNLIAFISVLVIVSCSSQQQQQQELPAQQGEGNQSLQEGANSQKGSNESLGAETNNATTDEFAGNAAPAPTNNQALLNVPANNMAGGAGGAAPLNPAAPANAAAPANGAPLNAAAAPANAAAATAAPAAPANAAAAPVQMEGKEFTNPHMNWPGKGRVKYVRGSAAKHQQPGGQVVGNMEQGEHPLVMKEGEWSELSDGSYTQSSNLSEQGVGRGKKSAHWQ